MYRIVILISAFLLSVAGMLYVQGDERRNPSDLMSVIDPASLVGVAQLSAPANQALPDTPSTGANALAAADAATSPQGDDEQMAVMTASVLAGLGAARNPGATGGSDLQGLVAQALRSGQSDAYIEMLLDEAAATGRMAVPNGASPVLGAADAQTLLASIVAQDQTEADAYTRALVTEATAAAPAAAAPLPKPATFSQNGAAYYTVEPGDSLASIAIKFYGSSAGFTRIFEANRDQIANPEEIRVGQRLRIPD